MTTFSLVLTLVPKVHLSFKYALLEYTLFAVLDNTLRFF
jgi:hypothetical protein